jgi:hypothetical protein
VLLFPTSTGDSKSLGVTVKTPPADVIEKKEPSVPLFDQVTDSLAVKVWTAVAVSAIEIELVAPVADDGPVIVGAVVSGK